MKKNLQLRIFLYSFLSIIIPIIVFCIKSYNDSYIYNPNEITLDDETYCKYVSSQGLAKICMQTKHCVYLTEDQIASFKVPDKKFVLLTNCNDLTVPNDMPQVAQALASPSLIKWFSKNVIAQTDKLKLIPIGLDYHSLYLFPDLHLGPPESPLKQEQLIEKLNKKPFYAREIKIYCNFLHSIRGHYSQERALALQQVPAELIIAEPKYIPRRQSWKNLSKYAFVLSPPGNGLDCHRTWEALALGSIPIVKSGPLDPLYADLPVLIVKEWSDISAELLKTIIADFKTRQFKYEKITLKYWAEQFQQYN